MESSTMKPATKAGAVDLMPCFICRPFKRIGVFLLAGPLGNRPAATTKPLRRTSTQPEFAEQSPDCYPIAMVSVLTRSS